MGRNNALTLPLLEYLSHRAGCAYLSDLKYINGCKEHGWPVCWRRFQHGQQIFAPGTTRWTIWHKPRQSRRRKTPEHC